MTEKLKIKTKRVYEKVEADDGYRLLVDRIWPRGIKKEAARLHEWNKDLAPSEELRKWFDHKEDRFEEFKERYKKELKEQQKDLLRVKETAKDTLVCLLYGAKDEKYNQAVVLKEVLESLS